MVTLKDIAREAEVSFQAVSSVLNGTGGTRTSKEKRDLILKIAKKLNYTPNRIASGLRTKCSNTIGVIFPGALDAYYSELMHQMILELEKEDYLGLFSFMIHEQSERVNKLLKQFVSRKVDGIIAYCSPSMIGKTDVPVLYVTTGAVEYQTCNSDFISIDFEYYIEHALDYLKSLGHCDIAYIGSHCDARYIHFCDRIEKKNLVSLPEWRYHGWGVPKTGRAGVEQLLAAEKRPTAILAFNDVIAMSAIDTLRENGYEVPRDFSVLGFDNIETSSYCFPRLTTFDTQILYDAELMIQMLLQRIKEPGSVFRMEKIITKLIERDSCAKLEKNQQKG